MPRPLRVESPGALYHVTARGNAGRRIFREDGDRALFLELLARAAKRRDWLCHAFCLMDNHYHLLVETPEMGLAQGMQWVNGVYAQWFNRTGRRSGHLFQGRYHAAVIMSDAHLLEVARYIVLNPVRAGLCAGPGDWTWSSFLATVGERPLEPPLVIDVVLAQLGGPSGAAQTRYRAFIAAGLASA